MLSLRLSTSLAVRSLGGIVFFAFAGCCCGPVCQDGNACHPAGSSAAGHPRVLRRGTLPPPVPAPAVASPIPRYHALPTHPAFESQPQYPPLAALSRDPELPAPQLLPEATGEPTPALLPSAAGK